MLDIMLTTYNRLEFLKRTIDSIFSKTRMPAYHLFIVDDCSTDGTAEYLASLKNEHLKGVVLSKQRKGLRYEFNILWTKVEAYNLAYGEFPYLCYHQDDVEILNDRWAETLIEAYQNLKAKYNVGFFSGCDSSEHPTRQKIQWRGKEILLKTSQAFQNAIAEKDFWRSIGLAPRLNPDGLKPGLPNDGRGSNLDVWFMGCCSKSRYNRGAASPNCSFVQGKSVMVISMMKHLGKFENSTWRRL